MKTIVHIVFKQPSRLSKGGEGEGWLWREEKNGVIYSLLEHIFSFVF